MALPEAAVSDGEGGVCLAFGGDALGEVAGGEVRPVVVFFALGGAEFQPPGFGFSPLGFEERPEGGTVDHYTVVEIEAEAGIGFAGGVAGFGWGCALFGDLLDEIGKGFEFGGELENFAVAIFGLVLLLFVALVAGVHQVAEFAFELAEFGKEVFGEEGGEGAVCPAVDADVSDEVFIGGGEGEVDWALLVHLDVNVFEEIEAEPFAEGFGRRDRATVLLPCGSEGLAGGMGEAVC